MSELFIQNKEGYFCSRSDQHVIANQHDVIEFKKRWEVVIREDEGLPLKKQKIKEELKKAVQDSLSIIEGMYVQTQRISYTSDDTNVYRATVEEKGLMIPNNMTQVYHQIRENAKKKTRMNRYGQFDFNWNDYAVEAPRLWQGQELRDLYLTMKKVAADSGVWEYSLRQQLDCNMEQYTAWTLGSFTASPAPFKVELFKDNQGNVIPTHRHVEEMKERLQKATELLKHRVMMNKALKMVGMEDRYYMNEYKRLKTALERSWIEGLKIQYKNREDKVFSNQGFLLFSPGNNKYFGERGFHVNMSEAMIFTSPKAAFTKGRRNGWDKAIAVEVDLKFKGVVEYDAKNPQGVGDLAMLMARQEKEDLERLMASLQEESLESRLEKAKKELARLEEKAQVEQEEKKQKIAQGGQGTEGDMEKPKTTRRL